MRTNDDLLSRDEDESAEEIAAEDERWDALLATDESQRMLEKMADEALAEIQSGRARPRVFAEDGEITPHNPPAVPEAEAVWATMGGLYGRSVCEVTSQPVDRSGVPTQVPAGGDRNH